VNINALLQDYRYDVGAAGAAMPRQQEFFVSVDSGRDPYSGRPLAGHYRLKSWVNDVEPPVLRPLTTTVAAGRPELFVQSLDFGSGIDPYSLQISYRGAVVAASSFDQQSGLTVFRLPETAPALRPGHVQVTIEASDLQETKNVNTSGSNPLPNTAFQQTTLRVIRGTAISWLMPSRSACVAKRQQLAVAVSSTRRLRLVRFYDGIRQIAVDRKPASGMSIATWHSAGAARGRHVLRAVAVAADGTSASAARTIRVCR
jgi:hypothetical protein